MFLTGEEGKHWAGIDAIECEFDWPHFGGHFLDFFPPSVKVAPFIWQAGNARERAMEEIPYHVWLYARESRIAQSDRYMGHFDDGRDLRGPDHEITFVGRVVARAAQKQGIVQNVDPKPLERRDNAVEIPVLIEFDASRAVDVLLDYSLADRTMDWEVTPGEAQSQSALVCDVADRRKHLFGEEKLACHIR